ncbi:hypothetical protein MPTA5024_21790 [Microbispora sp. ATCC PTA-5024]|nr:hypothetical protein MPTA5024_21790 [Microbispora sp. ATCC PTA-5024]
MGEGHDTASCDTVGVQHDPGTDGANRLARLGSEVDTAMAGQPPLWRRVEPP